MQTPKATRSPNATHMKNEVHSEKGNQLKNSRFNPSAKTLLFFLCGPLCHLLRKGGKAVFHRLQDALADTRRDFKETLNWTRFPLNDAQCRWGAVLLAGLFVLQLGRLACLRQNRPRRVQNHLACPLQVQVGKPRGKVFCLQNSRRASRLLPLSGACRAALQRKLQTRRLRSGDRIVCTRRGRVAHIRFARMKPALLALFEIPLDLNRATAAELASIHGVGPALSRRIVSHRKQQGPFRTVEELRAVHGIGPHVLRRIRPRVRVSNRSMQTSTK
jgi:competence protein ComEA